LICSSFNASSSLGRLRSAFSAPTRNFSRQSSTSATVSPWVRAASATDVSPFRMLTTSATRRFAVHRSMDSVDSAAISPPPWSTRNHVLTVVSISRGAGYDYLVFLPKVGEQQQDLRKPLFAGVKELIDQGLFDLNVA